MAPNIGEVIFYCPAEKSYGERMGGITDCGPYAYDREVFGGSQTLVAADGDGVGYAMDARDREELAEV